MARHRIESRRLPLEAVGLAVVVALWCAGDATPPMLHGAARTTPAAPVPGPARSGAPGPAPATARLLSGEDPALGAIAAPSPAGAPGPAALPASPPSRLVVERIGLTDETMELGRRPDRTLEVPPEAPGSPAGWYRGSPAPGEPGPAVFLGHVNATGGGRGVFADLHLLVPGDTIRVERRDGSRAVFTVRVAERYAKDTFPTLRVYGNTPGPELRLITCDGYDPENGSFDENLVGYATLTA